MEQSVDLVVASVEAVWPQLQQAPGSWLAAGEAWRLERIADPGRAREFVASRCLMRLLLSAHTGYDRGWWHWVLEAPENATPMVQACRIDGVALHLNLSHSQGLLACTLSHRRVGVDLEVQRGRRRRDLDGLMAVVCSRKERAHLAALPDDAARQRAFTQLWTFKESYFKWLGTGIDLERLPKLCSRGERLGGEPACCIGWAGDWAGRAYDVAICTGALPAKVHAMVLAGVKIQELGQSSSNLMLEYEA